MSKMIIVEGNSNDKDQIRNYMVSGLPGISPTATVTKTDGVATITITDENGTTTATVSDGEKGDPGATSNIIDSDTLTDNTTQTYSGRIVDNKIEDSVIPVHDEYSTSTTEPYSANYVNENMHGVVLYESETGTTGDVTLNESVQGYNYIEVYAHRLVGYFSQKIYQPNGKDFSLTSSYYTNNIVYLYTQSNTISGNTITRGSSVVLEARSTGNVINVETSEPRMYIDKVIGYK